MAKLSDGLQALDVQSGDHRSTLIVAQDLARLVRKIERNRRAVCRPDSENRYGDVAGGVTGDVADALDTVSEHHNAALGQPGILQQLVCLEDGILGLAAEHRHHLGRQGVQQINHGVPVVGERCYGVCVAGISHEADKAFVVQIQQVGNLVPRADDSGRWRVVDQHRQRQIEHHHQRFGALFNGLRQPGEGWPSDTNAGNHQRGAQQGGDMPVAALRGAFEQHFEQCGVYPVGPAAGRAHAAQKVYGQPHPRHDTQ